MDTLHPGNNKNETRLTKQEYWEDYWSSYKLPLEIKKSKDSLYLNEILNTFDTYLPKDSQLSILEIGGSPGQYLIYMHRQFGYKIHCLDYSEIGCLKTKENYELLNIQGEIYQQDLFSENLNLPLFDIVYSLGFVEHFSNLNPVIEKHLRLLKQGGILVIGAPNFLGINHWFLKRLAPELLSKHNLEAMDISTWASFEKEFNLGIVFKGYVGGFEPQIFNRREKKSFSNSILKSMARNLSSVFTHHFKGLREFNSKYFSGYVMGVYQKL